MPLQLAVDPSTDLPKRVVWDIDKPGDYEAASKTIEEFMAMGYAVDYVTAGEAHLTPPPRASDQLLIRVLDDNGDSRILWNRHKQGEVEDARRRFDEYMKKGYRAYVCRSDGSKGARVETFDALLEEIIVAPGQAGDQGLGEYRRPKEAVLVPPTAPG
jgi:hypothetical protein